MKKHSKLLYRAVARIRAFNEKNGAVYIDRLRQVFSIGFKRSFELHDELIEAGVIRDWDNKDLSRKTGTPSRGNILWSNLSKIRVPKEITTQERERVRVGKLKLKTIKIYD